eukprot:6180056-Pleurochrysis_carterae.AAC.1
MHLSSTRLAELIVRHDMLEGSDDEILKEDNCTAKRIRNNCIYFWGVAILSRAHSRGRNSER